MVSSPALGYPRRAQRLEKTFVANLWIIAGVLLSLGAGVSAWLVLRRGSGPALPPIEEIDDVGLLKERLQLYRAMEEDLIAAGQALGRVRRFLVDPEEAGPVVDELRERLTDLWLRRFDYEGRLRMAAIRRRIPRPLSIQMLEDQLSADSAESLVLTLQDHSDHFREVANRAEDSARMFRRLAPAEDAHARWVGEAVEVAQEWRLTQTEEIQRLAARLNAHADRLEELSVQVGESLADALQADLGGLHPSAVTIDVSGLRERVRWVARVGLAEAREREIEQGSESEADAERAVEEARQTIVEVRALARRAGATRSTRTPSLPPSEEPEASPASE